MNVTLYSKPGCHLCEDVLTDLHVLQERYPHSLYVVDITADAELLQRYGERIPVVEIAGREFEAPLSADTLERVLRSAGTRKP